MTRYFLTRLKVEGFRGINNEADPLQLKFKPDTVNSVFAVNGVGKSSLFEALCFAIQGEVPKLGALQALERPQDYYGNRFHSTGNATIELEFLPDDGGEPIGIIVTRSPAGVRLVASPTGHASPEQFLASLKEQFALLDYKTFMNFIEDSSLKRGRNFSTLIGLSEYSNLRQALQSVSETRTLNGDLDIRLIANTMATVKSDVQQSLRSLVANYEKVLGKPLTDTSKANEAAVEIVEALASVDLLKPILAGQELEVVDFEAVKAAIREAEGGERRQDLAVIVGQIGKLEALVVDVSAVQAEQNTLLQKVSEKAALLEATKGDLFQDLYDAASSLIKSGEWPKDTECPLCESELDHSIHEHINRQLQQYGTASAKMEELSIFWSSSAWRASFSEMEGSDALAIPLSERKFANIDSLISKGDISIEVVKEGIEWSKELVDRVESQLKVAINKKNEIEKEIPASLVQLTEQVEYGKAFKESLGQFRQKLKEESALQAKLDARERWKEFIVAASSVFSNAEAALSRSTVSKIENSYKEMFADIMGVNDVVPELQREAGSEDLHVQLSEFHGQHKLSARALLSESFRNALAISVFLAAAMKHRGAPRFVVLDDVTSSFDSGHQYMLMELIRTKLQQPSNAEGLQFIILSHDGLLEKYFDRLGGTKSWSHTRLQGSPPMGTVLSSSQGADRLKITIEKFLKGGQIQQAEPLIRQYLEFKLQMIIRKINIPVPIDFAIKDTNKMAQNCLDAITDAIKLHKLAGDLVLDSKQVADLETVHVPAILGNWVSHYATGSGTSLSAPVLQAVVKTVDSLEDCFQFDDNSSGTTQRKWYRSLSQR